jgi:hypothetical protein
MSSHTYGRVSDHIHLDNCTVLPAQAFVILLLYLIQIQFFFAICLAFIVNVFVSTDRLLCGETDEKKTDRAERFPITFDESCPSKP